MGNGIVYILDDKNEIVHQFTVDWNIAVNMYHGKRDHRGRFYIAPEGKPVPFKRKKKKLRDIRPVPQH